jgi:O-antigen ligase
MKLPLLLLAIALGLAPVIGGQLSVDTQPLGPGLGALVGSFFSGAATPALSAALLGCLALVALALVLVRNRAIQAPAWTVGLPLAALFALLGVSVGVSEFRFVSAQAWVQWLAYWAAFAAVMASAGRERGPRLLVWALVAGCAILALRGIAEYGAMRAIDPAHRIFAGWVNPNALAGMLLLGLFPALVLTLSGERAARLLAGAAAVVIGLALVLTQSRGGVVAAGIGVGALMVAFLAWGGARRAWPAMVPLALVAALTFAVQETAQLQAPDARGVMARIAQGGAVEQQAAGFRLLLWRGALVLMRDQPSGAGAGAYRFSSARPGLHQQTHLAHNTFLQLGVEATAVAPVLLLLAGAAWTVLVFRGARRMPLEKNLLRAGVFAAVAAGAAHNMVDSDLYHFGVGFAYFALLAIGLQLAADGGSPELAPRPLRLSGAGFCAVLALLLSYFGAVEATRARVLGDAAAGDVSGVVAGLRRLAAIAPADGESWMLRAQLSPDARDPARRLSYLEGAVRRAPTLRGLRMLARERAARGELATAEAILSRVFRADPNNLPGLFQRMIMRSEAGNLEGALADARRLVEIEASPYVQGRAIVELVPRQPIEARLFLARHATAPRERAELLRGALDGYARYAASTLPMVRLLTGGKDGRHYAGETWRDAVEAMALARNAATELAAIYRALGEPERASEVEALASTVFGEPAI